MAAGLEEDSTEHRRLVVISYFHPPFPAAGGNRWLAMSHYLRGLGYSVRVIASNAWGTLPSDPEQSVTRIADLRSIGIFRRLLRRGKLPVAGDADLLERPPTALLTRLVVPDLHAVSWLPAVVLTVRRMIGRAEVDCLVTSSPPASAHLLGLLLGRGRPAWIADFRDGWCFESGRDPFFTSMQHRLDAWLERRVAQRADVAVGATMPIARDLDARLGARAAFVPNGWDPRLAAPPDDAPFTGTPSGVATLVHTGTLSGLRGRDPEPLLRALVQLRSEANSNFVRLLLAGRLTTEERALISRCGASDLVEHVGTVDRQRALGLQRTADALLLLTSRNASEASSKIFEYMASGRPILALAEANEAARIVRETNTGVTVPPDDVDAIVGALRRVASGDLARAYEPRGIERFTYPGPAETMAALVEEAIRRRDERLDSRSR